MGGFNPPGTGVLGAAAFAQGVEQSARGILDMVIQRKMQKQAEQLRLLKETLSMMIEGPSATAQSISMGQQAIQLLSDGEDPQKVFQGLFEMPEDGFGGGAETGGPGALGAAPPTVPTLAPGAAPQPTVQGPQPAREGSTAGFEPMADLGAGIPGVGSTLPAAQPPAPNQGGGIQLPGATPPTGFAGGLAAKPAGGLDAPPPGGAPGAAEAPTGPVQGASPQTGVLEVFNPQPGVIAPPGSDVGMALTEAEALTPTTGIVQRIDPVSRLSQTEQELAQLRQHRAGLTQTLEQLVTGARGVRNRLGLAPVSEIQQVRSEIEYADEIIKQAEEIRRQQEQAVFQADRGATSDLNQRGRTVGSSGRQLLSGERGRRQETSERRADERFKLEEAQREQQLAGDERTRKRQAERLQLEQTIAKDVFDSIAKLRGTGGVSVDAIGAGKSMPKLAAETYFEGLQRLGVDLQAGREGLQDLAAELQGVAPERADPAAGIPGVRSAIEAVFAARRNAETLFGVRSTVAAALQEIAAMEDDDAAAAAFAELPDPRQFFNLEPALAAEMAELAGF